MRLTSWFKINFYDCAQRLNFSLAWLGNLFVSLKNAQGPLLHFLHPNFGSYIMSARYLIINISRSDSFLLSNFFVSSSLHEKFWCAINNSASTKLFWLSVHSWYWIIYSANFSMPKTESTFFYVWQYLFVLTGKEGNKVTKDMQLGERLPLFRHRMNSKIITLATRKA